MTTGQFQGDGPTHGGANHPNRLVGWKLVQQMAQMLHDGLGADAGFGMAWAEPEAIEIRDQQSVISAQQRGQSTELQV